MSLRRNISTAIGVGMMMFSVGARADATTWVYENITVPAQTTCQELPEVTTTELYAFCVQYIFASNLNDIVYGEGGIYYWLPIINDEWYPVYCSGLYLGCSGTIAYVAWLGQIAEALQYQLENWHP